MSRRILAIGGMYPPHHVGGYELMWEAAMGRARAVGHEVRILASTYRRPEVSSDDDPAVYRSLRWYWDQQRHVYPRPSPMERVRIERHNASQLRWHLRTFRPEVISWWLMGGMSLSLIEQVRRAGIPSVFFVHDDWLVYGPIRDAWMRIWRGRRARFAFLAERLLGVPTRVRPELAGSFAFNSDYTLERARAAGFHASAVSVIHPGIEERFLQRRPPNPWSWRVAYVGRIDRQKGVDTAIRALTRLPAATLALWGYADDRSRHELQTLATSLEVADRLTWHGFVNGDLVAAAYGQADVVVFPVRWEEPFGLVPLEAMGIGRPVVSTSRGGTAEFVRDGDNALVVAPDDAEGLAAAIQRLAADERLRERLRDGGSSTARRFTAAEFAAQAVRAMAAAATQA